MKNISKILLFSCLLICCALSGCVRNEFKVTVEIGGDVNRTYRTLYYASDPKKGWIIESVIQVTAGKAEMVMATRNDALVYIFSDSRTPATFFFARRGDKIKIEGQGAEPWAWTITGNDINTQLSEWRKNNRKSIENINAGKPGASEELNKAVEKFINANPENPVSTLLLLEYYNRRDNEDGYEKCRAKLKGEAAKGKWFELVSRNDVIDEQYGRSIPKQLILNTVATGCDTIGFGKVPVLLNFSKSTAESYRDDVKELKLLSKESGDSSARIIANILLEPDSLMRWQTARKDSLSGIVEGWMPLGLSDLQARHLGITRIPYIIVAAADGKIIYRGDDLKKASEVFGKQIKK